MGQCNPLNVQEEDRRVRVMWCETWLVTVGFEDERGTCTKECLYPPGAEKSKKRDSLPERKMASLTNLFKWLQYPQRTKEYQHSYIKLAYTVYDVVLSCY